MRRLYAELLCLFHRSEKGPELDNLLVSSAMLMSAVQCGVLLIALMLLNIFELTSLSHRSMVALLLAGMLAFAAATSHTPLAAEAMHWCESWKTQDVSAGSSHSS